MDKTLQGFIEQLIENPMMSQWVTDSGELLDGMLMCSQNGSLKLVITSKNKVSIAFESIAQHSKLEPEIGYELFPMPGDKYIPASSMSGQYTLNIWYVKYRGMSRTHAAKIPGYSGSLRMGFKSFLWGVLPSSHKDGKMIIDTDSQEFADRKIESEIGSITIGSNITETHSNSTLTLSVGMQNIDVTLEPKTHLDDKEVIALQSKFSSLLSFIDQRSVKLTYLQFNNETYFLPWQYTSDKNEQGYAYKSPIGLSEGFDLIEQTTKLFLEKHGKVNTIVSDLVSYYEDYAKPIPDEVQLFRLFSAMEQTANLALNTEPPLTAEISELEASRTSEYNTLKTIVKANSEFPESIKEFINSISNQYIKEGAQPKTRAKIQKLAMTINDAYEIHSNLIWDSKVKVVWTMRNIIAHGLDVNANEKLAKNRREFYENSGLLRTDTELIIRAYLLHFWGASPEIVKRHSEPLRAMVMTLHEDMKT